MARVTREQVLTEEVEEQALRFFSETLGELPDPRDCQLAQARCLGPKLPHPAADGRAGLADGSSWALAARPGGLRPHWGVRASRRDPRRSLTVQQDNTVIYQRSLELVRLVKEVIEQLPAGYGFLAEQLRRSASRSTSARATASRRRRSSGAFFASPAARRTRLRRPLMSASASASSRRQYTPQARTSATTWPRC